MADTRGPVVLLIAAHPDDEVIGAGSRLAPFPGLIIAHVTDGAPRNMIDAAKHGFCSAQDYARARRVELDRALEVLGASAERVELGFPDQGAAWLLTEVVRSLRGLIRTVDPDLILTHAYEGGHPDHDACAFAVHTAAAASHNIFEFASYHAGPNGIRTGAFLNGEGAVVELSPLQVAAKQRAFDCFETQRETLSLFQCRTECFRRAPVYDFTRPAHAGKLYYENFNWGMTGATFCDLVRRETPD
jgi:LmbE family N-acetylglucosaminyl deacetylase